ncbi:unnamed protein product [Rotaria sordida]|uniref:TLDc domain-containing protein n=1 Tax=Rotaria sordida TaxID=392033 RepID=A0A815PQ23_9BILA|nr:unnamed protein product [Rotaria sordida]CAF1639462.1 unnamed protein product [Rotaria sordida]
MNKKANEEWSQDFSKVQAVITDLDELASRIIDDHRIQKVVEEPLSINIFNGQSTTGVNGKFVFSQVLIDCLLRLKSNEKDKKELMTHFKKAYGGNNIELRNIHEFKKKYSPDKVLWWYSQESFFYKTLNAVLRNENIHMMFLFRQFIADIQYQLKSYSTNTTLRLFRGQRLSKEELETLEQNCGQLISVNSFFSTSTDEKAARDFLNAPHAANHLERVLFEINADPKMATTKPFADISSFSAYPGESEVLFMIGSIFRLNSIDQSSDDNIWIIQMTLCNENESNLKNVLLHMKDQLGTGETNLRTLGKLLWEMGRLNLAEQYFIRFLDELPANHHSLYDLYQDLGRIASLTGDYDKSVAYHQRSLALEGSNKSINTMDTSERNNQNTSDQYIKDEQQLFVGGTLLSNREHQFKLNEFYGKHNQKWKLVYKAAIHGFSAENFRRHCNGQGPTMIIIESKTGKYLFGAFTKLLWSNQRGYKQDTDSFLFTLTNPHGLLPSKFDINKSHSDHAVYHSGVGYIGEFHDFYLFGFGGDGLNWSNFLNSCDGVLSVRRGDLFIASDCNKNNYSSTKFPCSFIDSHGYGNKTFTGAAKFTVRQQVVPAILKFCFSATDQVEA